MGLSVTGQAVKLAVEKLNEPEFDCFFENIACPYYDDRGLAIGRDHHDIINGLLVAAENPACAARVAHASKRLIDLSRDKKKLLEKALKAADEMLFPLKAKLFLLKSFKASYDISIIPQHQLINYNVDYHQNLKDLEIYTRYVTKNCNVTRAYIANRIFINQQGDFTLDNKIIYALTAAYNHFDQPVPHSFNPKDYNTSDYASLRKVVSSVNDMGKILEEFEQFLRDKLVLPIMLQEHRQKIDFSRKSVNRAIFNSPLQVLNCAANWQERASYLNVVTQTAGVGEISWASLPAADFERLGLTFVPLHTPSDLTAEGLALDHCVGSYAGVCAKADSFIIAIRATDKAKLPANVAVYADQHIGTFEVTYDKDNHKNLKIEQIRGYEDADLPSCIVKAVQSYVKNLNKSPNLIDWDFIQATADKNVALQKEIEYLTEIGFDWRDRKKTEAIFDLLKTIILPPKKHGMTWQAFRQQVIAACEANQLRPDIGAGLELAA